MFYYVKCLLCVVPSGLSVFSFFLMSVLESGRCQCTMKMSDKDKDREFKNVYPDYVEGIQIYIPEQKRVMGHLEYLKKIETIERLMMWKMEMEEGVIMSSSGSFHQMPFLYWFFFEWSWEPASWNPEKSPKQKSLHIKKLWWKMW